MFKDVLDKYEPTNIVCIQGWEVFPKNIATVDLDSSPMELEKFVLDGNILCYAFIWLQCVQCSHKWYVGTLGGARVVGQRQLVWAARKENEARKVKEEYVVEARIILTLWK